MSAAKRVAHAAETIRARWERGIASDPQTEAAQALEDTCQLLDPEVAAELERLRARVADLEAGLPAMQKALFRALDRVAELEAAPKTVFRASHESIVMGRYDNRQAAMDHVHATLANEEGGDVTARVIWRADDPEADEPVWECWLFDADMADDQPTGYVVTPLEVASKYDEEADE